MVKKVKELEVGWSSFIPGTLVAVLNNWKDYPIDLYLTEFILLLRIKPDGLPFHVVMYDNKVKVAMLA